MINQGLSQEEASDLFKKQRLAFFAQVGQCIIAYQGVEDYLEDIFIELMGVSEIKSRAIFCLVKGLEAKLDIISAALCDSDPETNQLWSSLKKRIRISFNNRNQIAHSKSVSTSDPVVVTVDTEPGPTPDSPPRIKGVLSTKGGGNSRVEAWKTTKGGTIKWNEMLLFEECHRNHDLFGALVAFVMRSQGKEVPDHLSNL
jgi:hypothetical protein